ncbi:MAG: carbohydrate-binding protein [Proteobacteria bacterium]|nr:carbohydrate-binding protein [Pseudomonadota bacterium]
MRLLSNSLSRSFAFPYWAAVVALGLAMGCGEIPITVIDDTDSTPPASSDTANGDTVTPDTATPPDTASPDTASPDTGETPDTATTPPDTGETPDTATTPPDTGEDTGALRIEAECAFNLDIPACQGIVGMDSKSPIIDGWGFDPSVVTSFPALEDGGTAVGYFSGGSWIGFKQLDLTRYNEMVVAVAAKEPNDGTIGFDVRLDAPSGDRIVNVVVTPNGDWHDYQPARYPMLDEVHGLRDVYIIAKQQDVGNGNIDWIEFRP